MSASTSSISQAQRTKKPAADATLWICFADSNQIERLKSEGYRVDVREDGFKVALEATLEYSGVVSMLLSITRPRPPIAM